MKHKRIVAFLAACSLVFGLCAYAVDLPHAFWALNDSYNWALQTGDNDGIIWYGTQITDLLRQEADSAEKNEIMASRLDQIALAYERKGQYQSAAQCYREYLPYANQMGWADGVKIANAKVRQYTPDIQLYTETGRTQTYYGAKHEPETGVLYGRTLKGDIQGSLQDASMTLVYAELGDSSAMRWVDETLAEASRTGTAVEIAWNFPNEGDDVRQIRTKDGAIQAMADTIARYPNVAVFLRIGAEMNIWSNRAAGAEFADAFRYVVDSVRKTASNAAIVWSVAHASSWDIDMDEYYPGDEYVDWVGISAYMMPYFQGKDNWADADKFNEVVFSAGDSAEPVKLVQEVVERYGGRKPIMLAECGTAHYVRPLERDTTDFAKAHMQRMYEYLPMVYPQIKAIVYFDVVIDGEINDYALSTSNALEEVYQTKTKNGPFLQSGQTQPLCVYKKMDDSFEVDQSIVPFRTYAHIFGQVQPEVQYHIDGTWVASASEYPYCADIDFSGWQEGEHTLSVTACVNGQNVYEKQYAVFVRPPIRIQVNGETVASDVQPTIQDDRTLVPIRVISEKLNAKVDWDASNRRVTIQKADRVVQLDIDKRVAIVNGEELPLDAPAKLLGGRTFVPVRAVASMLGAEIGWEADTRTVKVAQNT